MFHYIPTTTVSQHGIEKGHANVPLKLGEDQDCTFAMILSRLLDVAWNWLLLTATHVDISACLVVSM